MPGKPKRRVTSGRAGHYVMEGDKTVAGPFDTASQALAASGLEEPRPAMESRRPPENVIRADPGDTGPDYNADAYILDEAGRRVSGPFRTMGQAAYYADHPIKPIASSLGGAYKKAAENDKERRRAAIAAALRGK